MNVLSLFDGIACGRVALDRAGIPVNNYFASEVDKNAMAVAKNNWPDIEHTGDVKNVSGLLLPKIDLLIGGSPCQGFSLQGKQLAFDDPRSKLFFEFVRLLKDCKPKYFLLENVRMKKEFLAIITNMLEVAPICINSALVSAQNRVRYYWTNIPGIQQPANKRLILADILERGVTRREGRIIYTNHELLTDIDADYCKEKLRCFNVGVTKRGGFLASTRVYSPKGKCPALLALTGGGLEKKVIADDTRYWRKLAPCEAERLQTLPENYTKGFSDRQRLKMLGNGWTVDVITHILGGLL